MLTHTLPHEGYAGIPQQANDRLWLPTAIQETEPMPHQVPSRADVLAIIPARSGSKGIPRKNAKPLCGKPLVSYSIEAALKSRLITQVVVSSDDEEILAIAREYGSTVPMPRPAELSGDSASLAHVTKYVVDTLKGQGYWPDFVTVLHPTSPFRNPRLIDFLVGKGLSGFGPVLTMRPINPHARRFIIGEGREKAYLDKNPAACRSMMRFYGLFSGNRHGGSSPSAYVHLVENEIQLIDIDYPEQFKLAERVVANGLFDFDLR